jgi:hypothetical protein
MSLSKRLVVTNHSNHDLKWLSDLNDYGFTPENIYIYERSGNGIRQYQHLGKVFESPNVGSNIYDYGRYIIENYDDLADINILIKGNITLRTYTNRERFIYALTANWFVPIDNDPIGCGISNYYEPWGEGFYVNDTSHLEKIERFMNENKNLKVYPKIKNIKDFLEDLFIIKRMPEYLSFCPGAKFVVPKQNILKYSKKFYQKMMDYTDYDINPMESHFFERVLPLAWQGCLLENYNY